MQQRVLPIIGCSTELLASSTVQQRVLPIIGCSRDLLARSTTCRQQRVLCIIGCSRELLEYPTYNEVKGAAESTTYITR